MTRDHEACDGPDYAHPILDKVPYYIESGIRALGALLATKLGGDPCGNTGTSFKNDVFSLNAYCWCDGDSHDVCPPNFDYPSTNFSVDWYKYIGRGMVMSRDITEKEWQEILQKCVESLGVEMVTL